MYTHIRQRTVPIVVHSYKVPNLYYAYTAYSPNPAYKVLSDFYGLRNRIWTYGSYPTKKYSRVIIEGISKVYKVKEKTAYLYGRHK